MSAADLGATGVLDVLGATVISLAMGMGNPSATPDANTSTEDYIAKQYKAAESLIGINLQTDLFQQLSGEYGGWLTASPDAQEVSGVFASGVEDPETVSNALQQLSFLIQGASGSESPLTTREVGGGQVYVIDLGDGAGSTLEFGVVDDYLVVGKGDAVERFAEEPADSLAENTQFQAVMDTLPVEHNGLTYIDLAQAIPLMEVASQESGDIGFGATDQIQDASESCGNYETQEEAQAAYDAAESGTFDLDQDFDGQVCEDYFGSAGTASETAEERLPLRTAPSRLMPWRMSTTRRSRRLPPSHTAMVMFSVRRPSSTSPSRLLFRRQAAIDGDGQGPRETRAPWWRFPWNGGNDMSTTNS